MNSSNFFAELKRRNVYKVAIAYIVGGWALSQGIAQVFPVFDVPTWAIRVLVVLIVAGLPVALVLAWMFELTPQGIKRTETADAMPAATRRKKHVWIYVVVVGVLMSVGLFLLGRYSAVTGAPRPITQPEARPGFQSQTATVPDKSIAVLPFDNLSRDPDNAYFAEGVQDEILTRLAKIGDLKVISRTSTEKYKSAPANLREIAQQLGVANIVEGSVQKANDQVRVNVQLINALTDAHLWADTYDRKLLDIFSAETEIAKTIADTLQAKLSGSEKSAISKKPTANPEAYELYLKARFFWNKRTGNDLKTAADYFQRAIDADPSYGSAYAGLAQSYLLIPVFGAGAPREFFPKATAAAHRAIKLDETSAEGHSTLAMLLLFDFKFKESEDEFRRAIELNPNYAPARFWYGECLMYLGRFVEGIAQINRAHELDPLSLVYSSNLGWAYHIARQDDQAITQLQKVIESDRGFHMAYFYLGMAYESKGMYEEAIAAYKTSRDLSGGYPGITGLGHAYAAAGQRSEALNIISQLESDLKQTNRVRATAFSIIFSGLNDRDKAFEWLEKAYEQRYEGVIFIKVQPYYDNLRGDPRYYDLLKRIGLNP